MRIKKMLILLMGCLGFLSACSTEPDKKTEKISEKIKKELFAAADCYQTIYASADKGKGMNPVLEKGRSTELFSGSEHVDIPPRVWKMTVICRMDGQWRKLCGRPKKAGRLPPCFLVSPDPVESTDMNLG